jgi:hypothetical protein
MLVLNGVMAANPIGLVMLGIAAIIGGTAFIVANWNKVINSWVAGFQVLFGATLISVEGFVNGIIDGINTVIGLLNNLGVAIGEVGKVDFGGNQVVAAGINRMDTQGLGNPTGQRLPSGYGNPAFANMPRFAEGGIVMGPMVGLVGEAGPEAIIPLDRMGKMGGATYNINISAMNADARVGEMIVSAIKKYERTSGSVFVSA